jgi:hypothetical protein
MKNKALLFLVIIMPVVLSAFNVQPYAKPLAQNNNSTIRNPSIPLVNQPRDRNWRLDSVEKRNTDATPGLLAPYEKTLNYYNDVLTTRIDSMQVMEWDSANAEWDYSYSRRFIYDATGEYVTDETMYNFNNPIPFVLINCIYDTQNRLVDMYQYNYSETEMQYYLVRRMNFAYTANSISQIMIINPGDGRSYYERYTFDQDEFFRNQSIYGTASPDSLNWGNLLYEDLLYHPNDTSTGSDYIHFISHNMIFDDEWSGLYGMLSELYLFSDWNGVGWISTDREIYTYNPADQITEILGQFFSVTYQNDYRYVFTYDTNSNLAQRDRQSYDGFMQVWTQVFERYIYTWGQFTSNADNLVAPIAFGLTVYPNPFNQSVMINLASKSHAPVNMEVYNLKGQLIKAFNESGKSLVWDGKDKDNNPVGIGVYLLRAVQDGKSTCRKIIRMK